MLNELHTPSHSTRLLIIHHTQHLSPNIGLNSACLLVVIYRISDAVTRAGILDATGTTIQVAVSGVLLDTI